MVTRSHHRCVGEYCQVCHSNMNLMFAFYRICVCHFCVGRTHLTKSSILRVISIAIQCIAYLVELIPSGEGCRLFLALFLSRPSAVRFIKTEKQLQRVFNLSGRHVRSTTNVIFCKFLPYSALYGIMEKMKQNKNLNPS